MLYTIEKPIEQHEMFAIPLSIYANGNIYVRVEEKEDLDSFLSLSRYGVVVREATEKEIDHVDGLEDELESHEDWIARFWPEEEAEIVLEIKDW